MSDGVTREELTKSLNEARAERNLSIRDLARIGSVPPATVQGWLNGRHFPTPALRPKYIHIVTHLGLGHLLHPGLWVAGRAKATPAPAYDAESGAEVRSELAPSA